MQAHLPHAFFSLGKCLDRFTQDLYFKPNACKGLIY
jgi:hypothetical protein